MEVSLTSWSDSHFGDVVFATDLSSPDPYMARVRENWAPDIEVILALELVKDRRGLVFDIGANIGTWCLPLAKGSSMDFLAIEALPSNVTVSPIKTL